MKISLKAGAVIVCALFAVLMLPIVITCFYTYPVLDDFSFGAAAHHAVMDGRSVLWAALQNAYSYYMTWQGVYTYNILASVQPYVWNVRLYFLSNLFMLLWVSVIMLYFFHTLLCGAFRASRPLWLISALLLLILYWELIPSPSEGIYWMDGSLNLVECSLIFLELALMLRYFLAKGAKRGHLAVLSCLLSVIIGGAIQSSTIALVMTGLACLAFPAVRRDATGKVILLAAALAVAGMVLNTLAPGNATRMDTMTGKSLPVSVFLAVYHGFKYFGQWMDTARIGVLLVICVLMAPVLKKSDFSFPRPFLAVLLCFGFYACAISVTFYTKGSTGSMRQLNYYFLCFTYSTAVMMIYLTGWLVKKYPKLVVIDGKSIPIGLIMAAVIMVASGMAGSGIQHLTSVDTALGLYHGTTQKYAAEMRKRTEILENPAISDAYLEPLSMILPYLPTEPLEAEPDFWTNQSVAAYYRKNSVQLIKGD